MCWRAILALCVIWAECASEFGMRVLKAYKTKLSPNNRQRGFFRRCAGTARFVYNWGLADRIDRYERGEKTSLYEQKKRFNALKYEEFPWIREVPASISEATFINLNTAYQNFFRRVKQGDTPGFPKFKRKGHHESFQLRGVRVRADGVYISKLGWVRLGERGYIPTDSEKYGVYATVSLRAGDWYISVLVYDDIEGIEASGEVIGVDFGLKDLAICSNGQVFENPRPLREAQRKLARLNKELARRKKGGANWHKTKAKLQKAHARVVNIRRYTLHQISHYLTYELKPAVIVLEDLNVSGMSKNHNLAQAISDVGFSELRRQIEYKAAWCGIEVVIADRWFPSSKTCSNCGTVRSELALNQRTFNCPDCGYTIDRDLNAAINLAALVKAQSAPDCPGS